MAYSYTPFVDGSSVPPINASFLNTLCAKVTELDENAVQPAAFASTSTADLYALTVNGWSTIPSSDDLPISMIITPTITNNAGAKIKTNWADNVEYPIYDTSTNAAVTAGVITMNQPVQLLFDGSKFWVTGNGKYLKYGLVANTDGYFDHTATKPTGTKRLNYSGYFYANRLYGAVYNDANADIAEGYPVCGVVEPGDIIAIQEDGCYVKNRIKENTKCIGVVSDNYAALYGMNYGDTPVGLCGRVSVKVVGTCKPGDMLVASDIAGVAYAKTSEDVNPNAVIGRALEMKNTFEISRVLTLIR